MAKSTKNTGATPSEQRKSLVRKLRAMEAVDSAGARTIDDLAQRLKVDRLAVYGLVNGTSGKAGSSPTCLAATGHVKVMKREGEGLSVYLTAKGRKTDFSEPPFVRANRTNGNGHASTKSDKSTRKVRARTDDGSTVEVAASAQ